MAGQQRHGMGGITDEQDPSLVPSRHDDLCNFVIVDPVRALLQSSWHQPLKTGIALLDFSARILRQACVRGPMNGEDRYVAAAQPIESDLGVDRVCQGELRAEVRMQLWIMEGECCGVKAEVAPVVPFRSEQLSAQRRMDTFGADEQIGGQFHTIAEDDADTVGAVAHLLDGCSVPQLRGGRQGFEQGKLQVRAHNTQELAVQGAGKLIVA